MARPVGGLPPVPVRRVAPRRGRGRRRRFGVGHDGHPPAAHPLAGDHRDATPALGRERPRRCHLRHPDRRHRAAHLCGRGLAQDRGVRRRRAGDRPRPPAHRPRPRAAEPPRPRRQRAGRATLRRRPARRRAARPGWARSSGSTSPWRSSSGSTRPTWSVARSGAFETPGEDRIEDHLGRLFFRPRGVARRRVHLARLRGQRRQRLPQQHRGRRPRHGRHRHGQRRRHLRPPSLSRPARPPRRPRRAHRPGQPSTLRERAAAPPRTVPATRSRRALCSCSTSTTSSRSTTRLGHNAGDQLLVTIARPAEAFHPLHRHRGAAGRRRVRHPAARRRPGRAQRVAELVVERGPRPRGNAGRRRASRHREHRGGHLPGGLGARRRRARARRHDDVRRQGGRPRPGRRPDRGRRARATHRGAAAVAEPDRGRPSSTTASSSTSSRS